MPSKIENTTASLSELNSTSEESSRTLFVPLLGQSNNNHMSIIYDPYQPGTTSNEDSGAIILGRELTNLTSSNVVTSDTRVTNFAIGGSKANGTNFYQYDNLVWWYPNENSPGGSLRQAESGLDEWLSKKGAQPTDEIAIIWSQGETDAGDLATGDPAAVEAYKESTKAIFDYFQTKFDTEVTFYLVPTGRFQGEAAANRGFDPETIDYINGGVELVRIAQEEIALERDDVHLTPDYSDLNMVYEEGSIYGDSYDAEYSEWSTDIWHLGRDGLKVNGDRLAQYIAVDRGESNVISFTDSFGNPADSISLARNGLLDLNISANANSNPIQGTDLPDVIVGSLNADEIIGGAGNDVIIASLGVDTLTGGAGSDVFFYDSLTYGDLTTHSDRILDFELNSDRLDIAELLKQANYTGSNPIADGYVKAVPLGEDSLKIQLDTDGTGGLSDTTLAIIQNIDSRAFQDRLAEQLIVTPTEF
jgi:Ca2+-binding RTX toxin-like protein